MIDRLGACLSSSTLVRDKAVINPRDLLDTRMITSSPCPHPYLHPRVAAGQRPLIATLPGPCREGTAILVELPLQPARPSTTPYTPSPRGRSRASPSVQVERRDPVPGALKLKPRLNIVGRASTNA
jgi:hypothetical protein